MNNEAALLIRLPLLALAAIILFFAGVFAYKKALNISRSNAALVFLLCVAAAIVSFLYRDSMPLPHRNGFWQREAVWPLLAATLLPFFAIPFLINLYRCWIGGRFTDAEKAPGMDGIRAWLRGGNLVCALFVSAFACIGYGYAFWGMLALTVMTLLAYPILNMAATSFQPVPPKTEDLSRNVSASCACWMRAKSPPRKALICSMPSVIRRNLPACPFRPPPVRIARWCSPG